MKPSILRPILHALARELGSTLLLLLGVSLVVFLVLYLAPGDPFAALLEGHAGGAAAGEGVREALGVPRSWYGQYLLWLGKMLRGDFGTSVRSGLPVLPEILRVGLNTLVLTLGAMAVTLLVAVPIALLEVRRGVTPLTWPLTLFAYVISALPVFWLGYLAIYLFMHQFGLFPVLSGVSGDQELGWLFFLLPIVVLGLGNGSVGEVVRHLREEMGRVLGEDYIRTARAKGASVWRHAFREGFLLPVSEMVAAKIPFLLGGAVVVEQVFNWPGMGRMAWQAAQDRDFPVIMGIAVAAALLVRGGSLAHRMIYVSVNPRASKE